jgi:hypothetical protein
LRNGVVAVLAHLHVAPTSPRGLDPQALPILLGEPRFRVVVSLVKNGLIFHDTA